MGFIRVFTSLLLGSLAFVAAMYGSVPWTVFFSVLTLFPTLDSIALDLQRHMRRQDDE